MKDISMFRFHLTERTTRRLLPLLPDEPTFADVKHALAKIDEIDNSPWRTPEEIASSSK